MPRPFKKQISDMPSKKMPLLLAAALLAGIWWYSTGTGKDKQSAQSAVNVTLATVTQQDIPILVHLVGNVVAYETVALKSRLDSQVKEVLFKNGDNVEEGQTLFELDDRQVRAQIAQFTASLSREKAQLVNAELQYTRAQQLRKTQVVAQAQVDEAKAMFEAQQALVGAAQANLENAEILLSYTHVTAPISGRTGTINVTRGNTVKANDTTPLVVINQIRPIRVQTSIPERYYEAVRAALDAGPVAVTAQSKDSQVTTEGKLEYVENTIDAASGTFAARAVFENADEKLWPGMFVNVSLDLGTQKDALTVPSVAVQGDEGKRFVYFADTQAMKAQRRDVEIGMNNGDIATITKGLMPGDQVIVDGILRVTDAASITPVTKEEKQ